MVLTPAQQAELEALQAEASKPEPRTETGIAGVLHVLLDVAAGAVPHLAADAWAELHHQVEDHLGEQPAEQPADDDQGASSSAGASSSKGKSSSGKAAGS
jgi:hypothetical protein